MATPSVWDRIRGSRIVQALLVYLGASWFVLQLTETLTGLLTLPEWVGPVAVLLMLAGLVVVLATAWVQSLPQTTAAEEAGQVPTDWQVAPSDVLASLKAGKLPHLTWGRVILGGVVALSLLFGGAGVFVLVTGGGSLLGPREAGAELAASGVAVLPFHVTGPDLDVYREGMVDLISANLDGLSEYRAIDARTVLARWNRDIGETADAGLDDALRVAGGTGARYAVVGSGVFLELVDALTVEVMRSLLDATDEASGAQTFRLASLLTGSVTALRHYLEGDAAFRRGRFGEAREALERAVAEDSTFALAHWRLSETIGWTQSIGAPEVRAAKEKAARYGNRLPAREATLLSLGSAIASVTPFDEAATLRGYVSRYPDDPDGWYLMGEAGLHTAAPTGITDVEVEQALYRAVELDPTFGPYYQHALEWSSAKGQAEKFRTLMEGHAAANVDAVLRAGFQLRWDLLQGSAEERAAAVASLEGLAAGELGRMNQGVLGFLDQNLDRAKPLIEAQSSGLSSALQNVYVQQGRFAELRSLLSAESAFSARSQLAALTLDLYEQGDALLDDVAAAYESVREGDPGPDLEVEVYALRAFLSLALGDQASFEVWREQALTTLKAALQAAPPGVFDVDGMMSSVTAAIESGRLFQMGDAEGAYQLMNEAVVDSPLYGEFIGELGELAWEAGHSRDAIRIFEGISRVPTERSSAKFRLGQAYEALGERDNALAAYRTFLYRMENADPGLSWVREAEEAVARLGA